MTRGQSTMQSSRRRCGAAPRHWPATAWQPGDRLVVEVVNSAAAVELYLGCLLLGAVWVGVNPAAPQADRQRLCALVRPALVVTDQPAAAPEGYRVVELAEILDDIAGPWTEPAPPVDRPCAVAFTSGTSGSPKPVVQNRVGASLTAAAAATRFHTDDSVGLILPLSIHNVMVVGAMATLLAGATAVVVTGLNARGVARACAEDRLTMLSALVPTTIFDLVHDDGIAPDALRSLRWAGSGGADLSDGLRAAVRGEVRRRRTRVLRVDRSGWSGVHGRVWRPTSPRLQRICPGAYADRDPRRYGSAAGPRAARSGVRLPGKRRTLGRVVQPTELGLDRGRNASATPSSLASPPATSACWTVMAGCTSTAAIRE